MSQLTWGKIGALIVAGLGLIVMYAPQAQGAVTTLNLSPNVGLWITLLAGIATQILSAIHAHQLEQVANSMPGTPVPVPAPVVKMKVGRLVVLFLGLMLLASSVMADNWIIPTTVLKPESSKLGLSIGGNTINGVLLPTASLGLATNQNIPSYGFTGAYDFVIGQETAVAGTSNTQLTPFVGVGGAVYVDFAPWVNSNLENPIEADLGFNLVGPEILGEVPTIAKTWNLQSGESKTTINFTAFFDVIPTATIIQVF